MKTERNPVIFIPGIMGSIGNDIIPGTGKLGFGVAKIIYNPLIKGLERYGYVQEEDLYICFYDWRKSNIESTLKYLIPIIERIKQTHGNKKIDIICHSMGGLIARTYIQRYYYKKEIGNLIMIATPNRGAVSAYYFWSQGNFYNIKNSRRGLQDLLSKGYIWLFQKLMNFSLGSENLEKIHEMFPSVRELIPSYDYGPYMCYKEGSVITTVPTFYSKYRNDFLDKLNYWSHLLKYGTNRTHCIIGNKNQTGQYLVFNKDVFVNRVNEDIIDIEYTDEGDKTVTSFSAQLDGFDYYTLNNNHHQIVEASINTIVNILKLEGQISEDKFSESVESNYIHVLLEGHANINISNKKTNRILAKVRRHNIFTKYEYILETYEGYSWLIIKGIPKGEYSINISELGVSEVTALIMTEHHDREYNSLVNKSKTLEVQVF